MDAAASTVVGKVVDLLFAKVGRQIGYLFRYKDNVADLEQKIKDLKGVRDRMKREIDVARRKGEVVVEDVQAWISSVENITSEVETFLANEGIAAQKIACFHLTSRYNSSKKAMKKASSVAELSGKANIFPTVSRAAPPLGIDAYASINIDDYESQKSSMKEVLDYLKEGTVDIIAICGVGGVGKTTLVTELGKRVKGNPFDEVAMAVVSRNVDVEKIQQDIATMLGMDKLPEDVNLRRDKLWGRILGGKKVLIILDDVWSTLDLNSLGIPVGKHNNPNCKVVLTSRDETECRYTGAQKIVPVNPMPETEAWALFRQVVMAEDIDMVVDINQIEGKIFRECGRLPIAIKAVGIALRNESKNDWKLVYDNMKEMSPIDNPVLREVFPVLATSYTYLKDEKAKSCFLLCSLFKEDAEIPVELLARYGMGLKIFQRGDRPLQDARRCCRTAVNTLKRSYLMLPGKNDDYVKMHDVVRDVAITISSKDENNMYLVKAGEGLTMWPDRDSFKMYTGISLMNNHISKLPPALECPKLQILLLQDNEQLETIDDDFLQEMKMLQVIDLMECRITSLPQSLSCCTMVRTLHLDGSNVRDISMLARLSELEILVLAETDVERIPEEIGRLTNLRLLDIRYCKNLSHIAPGVISSLHKLEDLYVGDSFMKWDVEEESNQTKNASLTELHSLQRLTNLDIVMPSLPPSLHNLQLKSLQRFVITFGRARLHPYDEFPHSSILSLGDVNIPQWGWIKGLMKDVDILRLVSCSNVSRLINTMNEGELSDCDNVSCLVDMAELESASFFSNLKELHLDSLPNLTQIIHGQLLPTDGSFSKLHEIYIAKCHKLSIALELNVLPMLNNLQKLEVQQCSLLQYIFGSGDKCYKEGETKFLPMLNEIRLERLDDLADIHAEDADQYVTLSNLEVLFIEGCEKLKRVFSPTVVKDLVSLGFVNISNCSILQHIFEPSEIGHTGIHGASFLQNLLMVTVVQCPNMRYVFSPSIAQRLSRLAILHVYGCESIEAIIGVEEDTATTSTSTDATTTEKILMFPSLKAIDLADLEGLKRFSSEHCNMMEYPSLSTLTVYGCENMERWGYGIQLTPNLMQENIREHDDMVRLRKGEHGMELSISNPRINK